MTLAQRLAVVLGITQVVSWATTYYVPAVATGAVAQDLGASPAAVIGAFSAALLVGGLSAPWVGRLIDRHGGRIVLATGMLLQAAGLLLLAGSNGLGQWYAGWVVLGAGMAAGLYDAAFATVGRVLGADAPGAIIGITLIGGFASTLGWPVGAVMIAQYGWRATLACYALAVMAVNFPLLLLFIPAQARGAGPGRAAMTPAMKPGRGAFALMAGFFTLRAAIATVMSVSAPALLRGLGLGTAEAVAIAALIGPAQVAARVVQATIGVRWTPLTTAWVGAGLLPLVTLLLVLAVTLPGDHLQLGALVFVLGYGFSNGVLTISRGVLPLALFGTEGYAARIGRLALPVLLAQAAAPTLAAPILSGWPAQQVFLLLGLASVLAMLCLLPLRRPG